MEKKAKKRLENAILSTTPQNMVRLCYNHTRRKESICH